MMYAKLALENVKKSTKDYLIYIVTLTACISMFYAFLSISSNYYEPNIGAEFNLDILGDGIKYAILLITILLMFLMQYVNHFMIQRRKREFAIQSIIGMEQSTIARLFFVESLIMGIFSLIVGIGLGGVFSQFITAMLLQMYHKPFEFSFMLFPDTIILTILFFCICFATVGLSQVRTIRKIKIIDMLNADRKNDILGTPHKWIYKLFPVNFVLYLLITFYNIRTLSYYFNGEFELVIKIWSAISIIVPILMLITHIRERFRRKEQNTVKQLFLIECIRLSVEDNKKRGCSVENQKLVLNDFLSDKPDFVVYDTYIDNGATGTNFHRPGFQQMLSDIEAGHINCVIVKDLSRLGRNSIDTGYYIEQYFHAHNVRFIAVTDQFDTADSGNLHGGIMLPLKNMINEAYALDIGRKIKAQARQAMKDGDYIGARAPYGYRKDPDNCHKLLIDENTAPVVKQIFEWAHEHVALNRIVRNLNEMGIPAPSHYKKTTGEITSPGLIGSGKWQTRTVMKILESEVYTGDLVQGKTKIVDHQQVKAGEDNLIIAKCTHEPIISHELFNAVQEYRKQICEESKATPKRPYTPNIFKGKVFCADCGRSLHRQRAERRKGPDTYWFHCLTNSRVEKDSCKGAMIQEKELISTVTAILEKELTVALGMSLPLFQLEARQKQEKDKLKIQMSAKRQEIEKTRRLIRGLYENFVQGILTNDEYFELKADYEHAINALSGEIEVFEKSMDSLDNQLARYRAMEKDAKTLAQDHVLTAELIERLIERIEIDHERNIHVTFRFKNEFQGKAVELCATM